MADGISGWVPVVSSFIGGAMAIGGVVVTQWITARREHLAQSKKLATERAFIGAGLVLYLQECHHQFTQVANDNGEYRDSQNGERNRVTTYQADLPDISAIEGDWTVLPGQLHLRIREIPRIMAAHARYISQVYENKCDYPEHKEFFKERRRRYQTLANQCVCLENELRTLCGFSDATDEE